MSIQKTSLFLIDGKEMLTPDENIGFSFEDLDSADSGRDESGIMHRIVVRYKVGSWSFDFSYLTDEELQYIESLFGNKPDFMFTHPSRTVPGASETTRCYRSKYSISWYNARRRLWRNYKFNIVEC